MDTIQSEKISRMRIWDFAVVILTGLLFLGPTLAAENLFSPDKNQNYELQSPFIQGFQDITDNHIKTMRETTLGVQPDLSPGLEDFTVEVANFLADGKTVYGVRIRVSGDEIVVTRGELESPRGGITFTLNRKTKVLTIGTSEDEAFVSYSRIADFQGYRGQLSAMSQIVRGAFFDQFLLDNPEDLARVGTVLQIIEAEIFLIKGGILGVSRDFEVETSTLIADGETEYVNSIRVSGDEVIVASGFLSPGSTDASITYTLDTKKQAMTISDNGEEVSHLSASEDPEAYLAALHQMIGIAERVVFELDRQDPEIYLDGLRKYIDKGRTIATIEVMKTSAGTPELTIDYIPEEVTREPFTLSGKTEPGVTLTLTVVMPNPEYKEYKEGSNQPKTITKVLDLLISESGSFNLFFFNGLAHGENTLILTATTADGLETTQTIKVNFDRSLIIQERVPELISQLESEDPTIVDSAIEELVTLASLDIAGLGHVVVDALVETFVNAGIERRNLDRNDPNYQEILSRTDRVAAVSARALAEVADPSLVGVFIDYLDENDYGYGRAPFNQEVKEILVQIGEEAIPELVENAHHEDWTVRLVVADALGEIGVSSSEVFQRQAIEALVSQLGDNWPGFSSSVGGQAAISLAKIGEASVPSTIEVLQTSNSPDVRRHAVLALMEISYSTIEVAQESKRALETALESEQSGTLRGLLFVAIDKVSARLKVLSAIEGKEDSEAIPILVDFLKDPSNTISAVANGYDVGSVAVELLIEKADPSAIPLLNEVLTESDSWISRKFAASAIGGLKLAEGLTVLEQAETTEQNRDVQWTINQAIQQIRKSLTETENLT